MWGGKRFAIEWSLGLVHKSMKYGQASASQGYCSGRAGHAVITQYVLMMVLAAGAVFI